MYIRMRVASSRKKNFSGSVRLLITEVIRPIQIAAAHQKIEGCDDEKIASTQAESKFGIAVANEKMQLEKGKLIMINQDVATLF